MKYVLNIQFFASKKGVGSTKNGRDSESKRLGAKLADGQFATAGSIIYRQRGTKIHPGENVKKGGGCKVGEKYWFEYIHDTGDNNENPNAEAFYCKLSDNNRYDEVYITDRELIENFEIVQRI